MDGEQSADACIRKAYDALEVSDSGAASEALMEALKLDYEHGEVLYALKCLNWWLARLERLGDLQYPYERGVFILAQWKPFYAFLDRMGEKYEACQYALKRFVFSQALREFRVILGDAGTGANQHDPGVLLQIGRCCKGAGNFEEALDYLVQAVRFKREDGAALAELADVNALLGEERKAKALFREAFFLDAAGVDLRSMESEMITALAEKVRAQGYDGQELAEWIPVYGRVLGVFSVKRELKPVELGRLRESVLALENELQAGGAEKEAVLKPRLLNRYFWLADYYGASGGRGSEAALEELTLKMKLLAPAVAEQFRL
jgi:tetratricopeptide (TPR) repeat protein